MNPQDRRDGFVRRIARFLGLALAFSLIFFFSAWFTVWWVTAGDPVPVPDLREKNVVSALKEAGRIGLDLRVVREEHHPTIPRDGIISQVPAPGTALKKDRNIEVVLSLGSKDFPVPDVRTMSLARAEQTLRNTGYFVGLLTWVHSGEARENTVLAQNPMPRTKTVRENRVDLLVGRGPRPERFRMPDLIGEEVRRAVALLGEAGISPSDVRFEEYPGVPGNRVIHQSPEAGYPVGTDSSIHLTVNRGGDVPKSVSFIRVPFAYRIPFRFLPVRVEIFVSDKQGTRKVFSGRKFPLSRIRLTLEIQGEATVQVYLDGVKVQSVKLPE